MLRLHIACHSVSTPEIMPLCETPEDPDFPFLPGEAIGAGRTFRVKRWGVKMDGDGFGYEMVDFALFSEH